MFPICKPHAAVLFHVPPPFLRCSFSLNTCICKKQPTNHENWGGDKKSVLLPWHSLSARDSMNSKCETYSLWARTIIKKVGEINRSPPRSPGASSPGAALQVAHPCFLPEREHPDKCILTRTAYFFLRTARKSLPVMSNHTVVCPRWQEKNTSYCRNC